MLRVRPLGSDSITSATSIFMSEIHPMDDRTEGVCSFLLPLRVQEERAVYEAVWKLSPDSLIFWVLILGFQTSE